MDLGLLPRCYVSVRNSLSRWHSMDKAFGWVFLKLAAKHRAKNWQIAIDTITKRLEMGDLGSARSNFIIPVVGKVDESMERGIIRKELNTNGSALVIAGCQLPTVALAASTYLMMRYSFTLKELTHKVRTRFESE